MRKNSRRKFLKKSALGGIGLVGFKPIEARKKEPVQFAEAGYEHNVDFSSLPDENFKSNKKLKKEALNQPNITKEIIQKSDGEELNNKIEFPGDRSTLVDPGTSYVNMDAPSLSVGSTDRDLLSAVEDKDTPRVISNNNVVMSLSSGGITGEKNQTQSILTTELASPARPIRGYNLVSDSSYRTPDFDFDTTESSGRLKVQAGRITKEVEEGSLAEIERSTEKVGLRLRTYDGSWTAEEVNVQPTLKLRNHGKSPRGDNL